MMRPIFFAVLALALLVPTMKAEAQQKLRKNETYCLQSSEGGSGGGMSLLCRYETLAQCNASKSSPRDWCMLNPVIGFSERGYDRREKNYDRTEKDYDRSERRYDRKQKGYDRRKDDYEDDDD